MDVRGRQAIAGVYEMLFRRVFVKNSFEASISSRRNLRTGTELLHVKVRGNLSHARMQDEQN
jgi:hypothetical protein